MTIAAPGDEFEMTESILVHLRSIAAQDLPRVWIAGEMYSLPLVLSELEILMEKARRYNDAVETAHDVACIINQKRK